MKALHTIKRLFDFIKHPVNEWNLIHSESFTLKQIIYSFGLPLLIFASLATFFGGSIISEIHSYKISVLKAVITFISMSSAIYLSALVLNEVSPKFFASKNFVMLLKVFVYSFGFFILSAGIADLHTYLKYFNLLGIYSLVLLWLGMKIVIGVPSDKVAGFAIIAFIFTIIIQTAIKFILSLLFLT